MKRYLAFLILVLSTICSNLFAAEAGMPQLDPKYWASQAFWLILVFSILYISIAKFYLPKIKKNLDDRENKIKEDLDEANKLKNLSDKKIKEYEVILENSKKEVVYLLAHRAQPLPFQFLGIPALNNRPYSLPQQDLLLQHPYTLQWILSLSPAI